MSTCWTTAADGRRQPKRRYETRSAANRALRSQRKAQGFDNSGQQPYRCDECGYFHLGHYPTSEGARSHLRSRHRERDDGWKPTHAPFDPEKARDAAATSAYGPGAPKK